MLWDTPHRSSTILRLFFPASYSLLSSMLMCPHRINPSLLISHSYSRPHLLHQYITISSDVFQYSYHIYFVSNIFFVCLVLLKIFLYKISAFVSQILVPGFIYLALIHDFFFTQLRLILHGDNTSSTSSCPY